MGDEFGARARELGSLRDQLEWAKEHGKSDLARAVENKIYGLEVWQQLQIEREVDDPNAPNSVNNATGG